MLKIGLCGNIASGKSVVENILFEKGFIVLDLDKVTHSLLNNNEEVKKKVHSLFKTLDRKAIGKIVFSNEDKRKELESIIHPKLKEFVLDFFDKNKNEKFVFISGALLFEAGFDSFFDKTVFINAEKEIRLKRLMKRNGFSEEEALKRIESQSAPYIKKVDYIIENNDTIEELKQKIDKLIKQIKENQ